MEERSDREFLKRNRAKLRAAREALNFVAQEKFAEIAADYLHEGRKLSSHPQLAPLIEDDLLYRHVFSQKGPALLDLYQRLVATVPSPKAVLEIGVKNGGSLAIWHRTFPNARIVGLDIGLAKAVRHDDIIYVEGSQTDLEGLARLAENYGPFDVVIDDGSHIPADQIATLRALAPHLAPSGAYVIEDVHTSRKPGETEVAYGADVWPDFVAYLFDHLRGYPQCPERPTDGQAAARAVAPYLSEVAIAYHSLILRAAPARRSAVAANAEKQAS